MSDNLKLFTEKLSKDELLKAELETALEGVAEENQTAAIIAFAKEKGCGLTLLDFAEDDSDIDLEELENVTGAGGRCDCRSNGTGRDDRTHELYCECRGFGLGIVPFGIDCKCVVHGSGRAYDD